jgi:hypothetical protein
MLDAGNEGRTQEALRLADTLRKNYSDFTFPTFGGAFSTADRTPPSEDRWPESEACSSQS